MSKSHKWWNPEKQTIEKHYKESMFKMVKLVGNKTTYLTPLNKAGKKLFGDKFLGVFAADTIPKNIENGKCLIANLDNHNEPGEHWVAICKHVSKNELLVYDTFARNIHKILPDLFNRSERIKTTEKDKEQKKSETNCGAHALAFIDIYYKYGPKAAEWI